MKTTIEIADPLLREAKRHAHENGTTLRALIEAGLRHVLEQRAKPKRHVMRDFSVGGEGVQPGIREGDIQQMRALARGPQLGYPEDLDEIDRYNEELYGKDDDK